MEMKVYLMNPFYSFINYNNCFLSRVRNKVWWQQQYGGRLIQEEGLLAVFFQAKLLLERPWDLPFVSYASYISTISIVVWVNRLHKTMNSMVLQMSDLIFILSLFFCNLSKKLIRSIFPQQQLERYIGQRERVTSPK